MDEGSECYGGEGARWAWEICMWVYERTWWASEEGSSGKPFGTGEVLGEYERKVEWAWEEGFTSVGIEFDGKGR